MHESASIRGRSGRERVVLLLWWLLGAVCVGVEPMAWAQVSVTAISDTVYQADGSAASGTVLVSWASFTTASGQSVPQGSTAVVLGSGGSMNVSLAPNVGSTPVGTYYTAVYHLDDGSTSREYWIVPVSSTPVKLSAVRASVLPLSVAMQTVTKQYVDQAIAQALTGVVPGDAMPYVLKAGDTMTGPLVLPGDPVSALQAATKGYADNGIAASQAAMTSYVDSATAKLQVATNSYADNGTAAAQVAMKSYVDSSTAALQVTLKSYADAGIAASQTALKSYADNGTAALQAGLAPSATVDATNASNITSGTLDPARLPAGFGGGDCSSTVAWSATPTFAVTCAHAVFHMPLNGNVTAETFTGLSAGQRITLIFQVGSTAGYTIAWSPAVHGGFATSGVSGTAGYTQAGKYLVQTLVVDTDGATLLNPGAINE